MAPNKKIRVGDSSMWAEGTTEELTKFLALNPKHFHAHNDYTNLALIIISVLFIGFIVLHFLYAFKWSEGAVFFIELLMILFPGVAIILIHKKWSNWGATIIAIIVALMLDLIGFGLITPGEAVQDIKESTEEWIRTKGE